MAFDVGLLKIFTLKEIERFAEQNKNEIFYGFAIDATFLCINSIQRYQKNLKELIEEYPMCFKTEKDKLDTKNNVGDWIHFADFLSLNQEDEDGYPTIGPFDRVLYDEHYNLLDSDQKNSEYAKAMDDILTFLTEQNAFQKLNRTDDFQIMRVEHNY